MKTNPISTLAAAGAVWICLCPTARAIFQEDYDSPLSVAENQPVARLWISRSGDLSHPLTVGIAVEEGPLSDPGRVVRWAESGKHFVPPEPTVRFGVGQASAPVDLRLIDNGLLDGPRNLTVMLTGVPKGETVSIGNGGKVRIEDNELGSDSDPRFVSPAFLAPSSAAEWGVWPSPLPGGRLLLLHPELGLAALQADGREDLKFGANVARLHLREIEVHAVLPDGSIIVRGPASRLMTLRPDGTFLQNLAVPNFLRVVGVEPSGQLLMLVKNDRGDAVLGRYRIGTDTVAASFVMLGAPALDPHVDVRLDLQGRILVQNSVQNHWSFLARYLPDGTVDDGFAPVLLRSGWLGILPRRDGRILLLDDRYSITQVNDAGHVDPIQAPETPTAWRGISSPLFPEKEAVDGSLLAVPLAESNLAAVVTWNADGSLNSRITRVGVPEWSGPSVISTEAGVIVDRALSVEGVECFGLARILTHPPERDFRVLVPSTVSAGNGPARLRVVRTGPTTDPASVVFRTTDGTAIAGVDYVGTSGKLEFAPLEVEKEVQVALLSDPANSGRRVFYFDLTDASAGYSQFQPTPVYLMPAVRLEVAPSDSAGAVTMKLNGTVPGAYYRVERSTDLKSWMPQAAFIATETTTVLNPVKTSNLGDRSVFFRVSR